MIGDSAIGQLEVPVYYSLTPNEETTIDERLNGVSTQQEVLVRFAEDVRIRRIEAGLDDAEINSIVLALLDPTQGKIEGLTTWIEAFMPDQKKVFDEEYPLYDRHMKAAYAEAIARHRLGDEDWQFEWGFDDNRDKPDVITPPLVMELALFAVQEKSGQRNKSKEIVGKEDFKGFSKTDIKKSSAEKKSAKQLTGAVSTG